MTTRMKEGLLQKVDVGSMTRLVDSLSTLLSPYVHNIDTLKSCTEFEKLESEVEVK